jgi:hypothetical protein
MAECGGAPPTNNLRELAYPTGPNLDFANKNEFATLSNRRKRNSHIFARARNDLYVLGASKVGFLFPIARVNAAWRWLEPLPLARLYLLTPRPSVPPVTAKVIGGGRVDFCWLVLNRAHVGPPTWGWLHRDRESSRS